MDRKDRDRGYRELRRALGLSLGLLLTVFLFSTFVNLLMLTGPLYMLQVYDRVLTSRSQETLLALSLLTGFLFLAMGLLDQARSRILARIGARLQDGLDRRVFEAALRRLTLAPEDPAALSAQRDLEAVQRLWAAPVLGALFDLPWTPLFLAAIFAFHSWLGWLALGGGAVLVLATLLHQRLAEAPLRRAAQLGLEADRLADRLKAEAELVQALGLAGAGHDRWRRVRSAALCQSLAAADLTGGFGALSKTLRLLLQSAMLGLGALLVLRQELGAGAMIAGSILMGRALAPVELTIGHWAVVQRARTGWHRLAALLARQPPDPPRTALPRPRALVEARDLSVAPPGGPPVLHGLGFRLEPGQALGVIGPSGAGKSSLARALTGVWPPVAGQIRLGAAPLDQYDTALLGGWLGYLPQRVTLFDGTVAENIARLQSNPEGGAVVAAARKAAAHDMILALPQGYDTPISGDGIRLSGGQIQRIGLARALYGDPVLLVLDEPNAHLDSEGSLALNRAIRAVKASDGAVLIMAHRPAAIQECDLLLVLEDGRQRAFGPRDRVLRDRVRNHGDILRAAGGAT
ncbi:MAG: type secretion system ATPase [Cereibacter sp.]|jgi:ATP-binding cassette subfamily C protein|nr:type secretion system ATPase [Cereibacter sp.]